jgi:hypothetical protein
MGLAASLLEAVLAEEQVMTAIDSESAHAIRANAAPGHYPVNLRFTVPFFPRSFFVTLIMGREKRGSTRLREERSRHPISTWGNLITVSTVLATIQVALLFVALIAINLA